jgi:hypothetical protein
LQRRPISFSAQKKRAVNPPAEECKIQEKLERTAQKVCKIRHVQRAKPGSEVIAAAPVVEPVVAVPYRVKGRMRALIALTRDAEQVQGKVEQPDPAV